LSESKEQNWLVDRLALSVKEAARVLGVSERTVREMLPELPHTHLGRRVVIPLEPLREWLYRRASTNKKSARSVTDEILAALEVPNYDNV
jgi:excisionase family DNA binding protein